MSAPYSIIPQCSPAVEINHIGILIPLRNLRRVPSHQYSHDHWPTTTSHMSTQAQALDCQLPRKFLLEDLIITPRRQAIRSPCRRHTISNRLFRLIIMHMDLRRRLRTFLIPRLYIPAHPHNIATSQVSVIRFLLITIKIRGLITKCPSLTITTTRLGLWSPRLSHNNRSISNSLPVGRRIKTHITRIRACRHGAINIPHTQKPGLCCSNITAIHKVLFIKFMSAQQRSVELDLTVIRRRFLMLTSAILAILPFRYPFMT
jgi:hypothetical protein